MLRRVPVPARAYLALAEIVSWRGRADLCEDIRDEIRRLVPAYCRSKGCIFSVAGDVAVWSSLL